MATLFNRQQIVASAMIGSGFARLTRQRRVGEACVLTFHGLRAPGEESGLIDATLHTPLNLFRELCSHLAEHYRVLPLSEIADTLTRGFKLPDRTVALTFDDGYESNFRLAFPILREFQLPATIFACTGFLDGTVRPWFQRVELAVVRATAPEVDLRVGSQLIAFRGGTRADRAAVLPQILAAFKRLPQAAVEENLDQLVAALRPEGGCIPAPLRPMNWSQARLLHQSRLITFGAHTHTHPILGRCTSAVARDEIFTSRDRLTAELGATPGLFAYPNGHDDDYTPETMNLLRDAGFQAAFTMTPGFAQRGADGFELPRYGSPETLQQAEATVSGAFELFKAWRRRFTRAFAL